MITSHQRQYDIILAPNARLVVFVVIPVLFRYVPAFFGVLGDLCVVIVAFSFIFFIEKEKNISELSLHAPLICASV